MGRSVEGKNEKEDIYLMVTCIRRGCLEGKPPLENCELCKVDLERGAPALEPDKESQVESKGRCDATFCK